MFFFIAVKKYIEAYHIIYYQFAPLFLKFSHDSPCRQKFTKEKIRAKYPKRFGKKE